MLDELDVRALKGPVAVDCRAEEARDTRRDAARDRIVEPERALRPAARADDAVSDVERDDEALAEGRDEVVEERPRSGADDDAGGAGAEQRLRVRDRTNAARR